MSRPHGKSNPLLTEQWHTPDVGDLDWNGNTIEPIPYDLGLGIRNMGTSVDMGAYEVFVPPPPPEADE